MPYSGILGNASLCRSRDNLRRRIPFEINQISETGTLAELSALVVSCCAKVFSGRYWMCSRCDDINSQLVVSIFVVRGMKRSDGGVEV